MDDICTYKLNTCLQTAISVFKSVHMHIKKVKKESDIFFILVMHVHPLVIASHRNHTIGRGIVRTPSSEAIMTARLTILISLATLTTIFCTVWIQYYTFSPLHCQGSFCWQAPYEEHKSISMVYIFHNL